MAYDGADYSGKRVDRLLLVADALDGVDPKKYNQSTWRVAEKNCGTVCCALGWGIEKHGVELDAGWEEETIREFLSVSKSVFFPILGGRSFMGENVSAWDVIGEHFGITPDEAEGLFGEGSYTARFYRVAGVNCLTPALVAARIREFALEGVDAHAVR